MIHLKKEQQLRQEQQHQQQVRLHEKLVFSAPAFVSSEAVPVDAEGAIIAQGSQF
jgi:hypothetical protein